MQILLFQSAAWRKWTRRWKTDGSRCVISWRYSKKNPTDATAQTSQFFRTNADKQSRSQAEISRQTPNNLFYLHRGLLVYGAGKEQKRLNWKAIAVGTALHLGAYRSNARQLMQGKTSLRSQARTASRSSLEIFQQLDYGLARLQAGFLEAADELKKSFAVKDGFNQTRQQAQWQTKQIILLICSRERRASRPTAWRSGKCAKLKSLLDFSQNSKRRKQQGTAVLRHGRTRQRR